MAMKGEGRRKKEKLYFAEEIRNPDSNWNGPPTKPPEGGGWKRERQKKDKRKLNKHPWMVT